MDMTAGTHPAHASPQLRSAAPAVQLQLSRPLLGLLLALLIGPWLLVLLLFADVRYDNSPDGDSAPGRRLASAGSGVTQGKPGRWGNLEYTPIRIDLPDEFVYIPPPDHPPIKWFFKGFSQSQALELLGTAGLAASQFEELKKAPWKTETDGTAVQPGDRLVLGLSPESRAKIYSQLVEFAENSQQINPVWFRPGQVDERIKGSGLAPASVALLKQLLYPHGSALLLFTDFEPAVRQLPNDEERRRFQKAVCRKKTLLAKLKIDSHSNIETLIGYWGAGGRRKDIAPLLQALQQEGDGSVNILCLLPAFMRERLYTHPDLTTNAPGTRTEDCFWSAMNVFHNPPDDRFNDLQHTYRTLKTDYYGIVTPSQLGDLVFLSTRNDTVVHAATYIADDIVFTKNGTAYIQPWILMHLQEMIDTYTVRYPQSGPLKPLYFRKKT